MEDEKMVETVKALVGVRSCINIEDIECAFCPGDKTVGGTPPEYWNCMRESESAKRWLAEHGIKE